jgi:hypothetical protein
MGVGRGFAWHIAWTEFAVPSFQRFRLTCSRIMAVHQKSENRSGLEALC